MLIQGVLLGGLYALFALGLSLLFGVLRLTNIAHGDFIVLLAYVAIAAVAALGRVTWWLAPLLAVAAFAFGYVLQRLLLQRTLVRDPLPSVVVTFGLSVVIQNGLLEAFSADPRAIDIGEVATRSIALGDGIAVGLLPLVVLALALACTLALQALFDRTLLGCAFRAVSDDRATAELMGLNARHVYALAAGIAFALTALAGLLQAVRTTVAPSDGPLTLLFAFEAVIIGGLGSFWGTFVGALVLGLAQQVGFRADPGWGIWFGHLVFLALLMLRPQGLFPRTRT